MKKISIYLLLILIILPSVVFAAKGRVISVATNPYYDSLCKTNDSNITSCAVIKVTGHIKEGCAQSNWWSYALNNTTVGGRNTLSLLLTALATQKRVHIDGYTGSDACEIFPGVVSLRNLYIDDPMLN